MAPSGQVRPSNAADGDVVKDQGPAGQVPRREGVLDLVLPGGEPVHRGIQVILITAAQAQHLAQGAGGGLLAQPAGDGQLGVRRDHLRHHHRGHQVPLPRRHGVDQLLQAQRPRRAEHRGDVPVRQAAGDLERALCGAAGAGWPLSTAARASTLASGQDDRLARVRFLTLPASR